MSVLLDALKKAAEEKKNLQENKENPNQSDLAIEPQEDLKGSDALAADLVEPFSLDSKDLNEDGSNLENVEATKKADSSLEASPSKEFNFKLSSNEPSDDSNVELSLNKDDEPSLPEFDVDSLSDLTIDEKSDTDHAIVLNETEQTVKPDNTTLKLNTESAGLNTASLDEVIEQNSLDSLVSSLPTDAIELVQSEPSKSEAGSQTNLPNRNNDAQNNDAVFVDDAVIEFSTKSNSGLELDSTNNQFDTQSFDWSLDDLPGYKIENTNQSVSPSHLNLEQNPILVSGANTPPKTRRTKYATSSKVFVSLFVFLLFVLIGFYGILYFQEQNEKLEKSMMKYNIASLNLAPKANQTQAPINSVTESNTGIAAQNSTLELIPSNSEITSDNVVDDSDTLAVTSPPSTSGSEIKTDASDVSKSEAQSTQLLSTAAVTKSNTKQKIIDSRVEKKYQPKVSEQASRAPIKAKSKPVVVKINQTKSLIAEAYEAYNMGNFNKAKNRFEAALRTDATNTKILMGLGAIAVINKDYATAINYYEKVLGLKPNDLNAVEAIANLAGAVPLNKEWEQQLSIVATKYPQSAVLQNAVGNRHAQNNDWLEAQKSYFNAVVNNPNSADYMLNLAVSYDHLGEYKLATQYYTKALAYAESSRASFNSQQVRARLVSIKQLMISGG